MSFWDTDAGQRGLEAWKMERADLLSAAADARECSTCGVATLDPVVFVDGDVLCRGCHDKQVTRAARDNGSLDTSTHAACGYRWDVHDNHVRTNTPPFGCPTETEARAQAGDR